MLTRNVIEEVRFVLHGHGGFQPGSFAEALITTFGRADAFNFERLALVFPDYAQAVTAWREGGAAGLDKLVAEL